MKILKVDNQISPQLVADLLNSAHSPADFVATDDLVSNDYVSRLLANENVGIFVSQSDSAGSGTFDGFCYVFRKKSPEFAHRAFIQAIAVMPEARGRGIGTALIKAAMAWAKSVGAESITLDVVAANEQAIRLYKKMDMREVGRISDGYRKDGVSYEVITYYKELT